MLFSHREVAQSGLAHLNGVQGVAGSNPALPMLFYNLGEGSFADELQDGSASP